ncbi:uncharacterized protein LOC132756631 isoform X1 [Ruditapes philippinarum]|uniref:uncharacterized protein LOC132756631 isoform X1 n=1 Tax=Ruditapes philippinarum TaxID=129788 RepID=UPI00295A60A8|nr:uncharacterized protein LOC132756631 isoform X1 [Ruditapes philippinarum]
MGIRLTLCLALFKSRYHIDHLLYGIQSSQSNTTIIADMRAFAICIALVLAVAGNVSSENCDNVYCHFGIGFVMNRMPTIAVCASNGVTYDYCDFKKAVCLDHTLKMASIGACPTP